MKGIKFNLILDDKPVRNIEQLRDNFSVEDILHTYKNGLLKKWLKVRGYNNYLNRIEKLDANNDKEIIKELINIFEMYVDEEELEQLMNIVDYINSKNVNEYLAIDRDDYTFSIKEYHKNYKNLLDSVEENNNNIGRLKAITESIEEHYIELYKIDYERIYSRFINKAPLFILSMLSKDSLKDEFLKIESLNDDLRRNAYSTNDKVDVQHIMKTNLSKVKMYSIGFDGEWCDVEDGKAIILNISKSYSSEYSKLYEFIKSSTENTNKFFIKVSDKNFKNIYSKKEYIGMILDGIRVMWEDSRLDGINVQYVLYEDVKDSLYTKEITVNQELEKYINKCTSNTEGHWRELESKDKKIMILSVPKDGFVRGNEDDKCYSSEINGQYKVFNGIEYSSKIDEPLIYMEV